MAFRSKDLVDSDLLHKLNRKMIIAIDGPAASGKGTLARNIASRFHLAHLDTGMLYRGLAYSVLCENSDPENDADVQSCLEKFLSNLGPDALSKKELRGDDVGGAASKVAAKPFVRTALLDYQQRFADDQPDNIYGVVLDGRDIGTVVCPDADVKIYVTATPEVRAQRRYDELTLNGIEIDFETVLADIIRRDARDAERAVAPLKPAADAFVMDTSKLNASEALSEAIQLVRAQLLEKPA